MPNTDEQALPQSGATSAERAPSRWRRRSIVIAVMVLAAGVLWAYRAPILLSAAQAWVVSDPLQAADAVVVLGGGANTRPFAAAEIYHAGLAKVVLLPVLKATRLEVAEVVKSHYVINREVLLKQGVPASAIIAIGTGVSNTRQEAAVVSEWAASAGAKKIIVVTERFPSRRVRWAFNRMLAPSGVTVIVNTVPELDFDVQHWWEDERGVITFQNEVLKYLYYRLKY